MSSRNAGTDFERLVAKIQQLVDPNATVTHNERLADRLGHKRQFDVVIEGEFAGHPVLGVVECKDLKKRVGTPELDAFITKSSDVNANFKILVSRRGFSVPAVEKANHYGIQTLSLLPNDEIGGDFIVGNVWYADIYYWEKASLTLLFEEDPSTPGNFEADRVCIDGKPLLDWFINYLEEHERLETRLGWVVTVRVEFDVPQVVRVNDEEEYTCIGVDFRAKKSLMKKERFVGINGTGFFDWKRNRATMPPGTTITTDSVPTDFDKWDDRSSDEPPDPGFLHIKIIAHRGVERRPDAIDLESL